jgi:hypothetical protein
MPTLVSSPQQRGIGVAWGITTSGYAYTGSASVTWTPNVKATEQNIDFEATLDDSSKDPITGATVGLVFSDFTQSIGLRVYPYDTTQALAATAASILPMPGDLLVLTEGTTNRADTIAAGTYVVLKSSRMRKVGGKAEFDVALKKYENSMAVVA